MAEAVTGVFMSLDLTKHMAYQLVLYIYVKALTK